MKTHTIYLNGRFQTATDKDISQFAPGNYDVDGVFETTRIMNGLPVFIDQHLERFYRGSARYNISLPYGRKKIKMLCQQTIAKNKITNGRLRFSVVRDKKVSFLIVAFKKSPENVSYQRGARALVSSVHRNFSATSHIKNQRWSLFRKAHDEAKVQKCDEAILLNNRKELVEGATTNLFMIKDKVLYTPAIACGCLNGVTRAQALKIGRQLGLSIAIGRFKQAKLYGADEAFLTNAYKGVVPLVKVDGRSIGKGRPGALTKTIMQHYQEMVRQSCSLEKN